MRDGTFSGRVRELKGEAERLTAESVYCGTVNRFDFMECAMWVRRRSTTEKIQTLHRGWFEQGTPLVVELSAERR